MPQAMSDNFEITDGRVALTLSPLFYLKACSSITSN